MFDRDSIIDSLAILPTISVMDTSESETTIVGGYHLVILKSPFSPDEPITDQHIGEKISRNYFTMERAIANAAYWWNRSSAYKSASDVYGVIIFKQDAPFVILTPTDPDSMFDGMTIAHAITPGKKEIRSREIRQIMVPTTLYPATRNWVEEYQDSFGNLLTNLCSIQPKMRELEVLLSEIRQNTGNRRDRYSKVQELSAEILSEWMQASFENIRDRSLWSDYYVGEYGHE